MRKHLLFALLMAASSLYGQSADNIKGNRKLQTESRKTAKFNYLLINGFFIAEITNDKPGHIQIEAESNVLPFVASEVRGDTLVISLAKGQAIYDMLKIRVKLGVGDLESINVKSFASLTSLKPLKGGNFSLCVDSWGHFESEVEVNHLDMTLGSSSNVKLTGKARSSNIRLDYKTRFEGNYFTSDVCKIDLTNESFAYLNVDKQLKASANYNSKLQFLGNPETEVLNTADGGVIERITRIR